MTARKLASLIAKREGKRSQARIGDIREILRIIVELSVESVEASETPSSIAMWGDPLQALNEAAWKIIDRRRAKAKRKAGR